MPSKYLEFSTMNLITWLLLVVQNVTEHNDNFSPVLQSRESPLAFRKGRGSDKEDQVCTRNNWGFMLAMTAFVPCIDNADP
jgi:hypothetical protein